MLVDWLLVLLTTVICEAQYIRIPLETNIYKRGINHSERAEFLHWHNYYRRQVANPKAADMIYLLYHKELETAALDWAVECNFNHGNFNFTRYQLDPAINIGQNIAVRIGGYNIQNAVFKWFNEYPDYSYKDKSCKPGAKCGHYEQVAGAVVTHIGCAIVYCPTFANSRIVKGDAYNIICDYYPSAIRAKWSWKDNVLVREKLSIYVEGEPCSACPDRYRVCEDKLCRSSPTCFTVDNQCKNPSNTTTCLCDASVYPVYHDTAASPSFIRSSPMPATVSAVGSVTSTTAAMAITNPTTTFKASTVTATNTMTALIAVKTSISHSASIHTVQSQTTAGSHSLKSQTTSGSHSLKSLTTASKLLHETSAKISEATSTEAVKQMSRTPNLSTLSGTHEIYGRESTQQSTAVKQTTVSSVERAAPKTSEAGSRHLESTTRKATVPEISTIDTQPDSTLMAATISTGHFRHGDNFTKASKMPFSPEDMQPMCFIKMSTRYLTRNDMLPKDPGVIGDELFQRRWNQIQRQPKVSLQVMEVVDSRAVPIGSELVNVQQRHLTVSAIACFVIFLCGHL